MMEFHFEKAPAVSWEQRLESRIERSAVVACVKRGAVTATLFYDEPEHKFALQARIPASDHGVLSACWVNAHGLRALVAGKARRKPQRSGPRVQRMRKTFPRWT